MLVFNGETRLEMPSIASSLSKILARGLAVGSDAKLRMKIIESV